MLGMDKNKGIMLMTALLVLVGVVHYNTAYQVGLSPGGGNFFASYGFYVGLFVLWSGIAVFILAKNRRQSLKIKKKEVKLSNGVDGKKMEDRISRKVEKRVSGKLERKVTQKVEKKLSKKISKKIDKKVKVLKG
jgi:hypothetical protein